jgi:hypothetical protein
MERLALIGTLSDGTQNYLLDAPGLGMLFLSMFEGHVVECTTWHDHIETYPEHKRTWCDLQVSGVAGTN